MLVEVEAPRAVSISESLTHLHVALGQGCRSQRRARESRSPSKLTREDSGFGFEAERGRRLRTSATHPKVSAMNSPRSSSRKPSS